MRALEESRKAGGGEVITVDFNHSCSEQLQRSIHKQEASPSQKACRQVFHQTSSSL
jgi:hypothetical protein